MPLSPLSSSPPFHHYTSISPKHVSLGIAVSVQPLVLAFGITGHTSVCLSDLGVGEGGGVEGVDDLKDSKRERERERERQGEKDIYIDEEGAIYEEREREREREKGGDEIVKEYSHTCM